MKGSVAICVLFLFLANALMVYGSNVAVFEGGNKEAAVSLSAPGCTEVVNFSIPAQCHILKASVNVSTPVTDKDAPNSPEAVQVYLNDTLLWEFNGTGYGPLGMQDEFINGKTEWKSGFGQDGGVNGTGIRLPKNAVVLNATLEMEARCPLVPEQYADFTGSAENDLLGHSVSDAGDVNGDGYADIIVGAARAGAAYIYYGGPAMDSIPDVILTGASKEDWFGASVSGTKDVNGDGYDDVIVGEWGGTIDMTGSAFIYFGAPAMDNAPDVTLTGEDSSDMFGFSVSGAGDVNGDGYDDVIVGAPYAPGGNGAGRAYIYYGGATMDNIPDVYLTGDATWDYFGLSVSGAGDLNGDGYPDVVVGEPGNDTGAIESGRAYCYYGGAAMDSTADVILTQVSEYGQFGHAVSGTGDVNKDGYNDIIVGAPGAGKAFIYFGGAAMDSTADVVLDRGPEYDYGWSVSGAGDVNGDGYNDVMVGAPWGNASETGRAYIYFGGPSMDSTGGQELAGAGAGDQFGMSVCGAGDVDKDGFCDLIVGADCNDSGASNAGRAYLFRSSAGIMHADVFVGQISLWSGRSVFNSTEVSRDFGPELSRLVNTSLPSGEDAYGNGYVDLPVQMVATGPGNVTLLNMRIAYSLDAAVPDFSDALNRYISGHADEKDPSGRLNVSLRVTSQSPGAVRLHDLLITIDEPPVLLSSIPDVGIDEGTANFTVLDLYNYFNDDFDPASALAFSIISAPPSNVTVSIYEGRYLSVDARIGNASWNWTGILKLKVRCTDRWGQATDSNQFRLTVRKVNHPPVFDGRPAPNATVGVEYDYRPLVHDGDNDPLSFTVDGPGGMKIDALTGKLAWTPATGGLFNVSMSVTDGIATIFQNFTINVYQPNRNPVIHSDPVESARVGVPYMYGMNVTDPDGDILTYSLTDAVPGISIDSRSGIIRWMPNVPGIFPVVADVTDGRGGDAVQAFNISVADAIRPWVQVHFPTEGGKVSGRIALDGAAGPGTFDLETVRLRIDGGDWRDTTGNRTWTFPLDSRGLRNGRHILEVRATDAGGYWGSETVNFTVANSVPSKGEIQPFMFGVLFLIVAAVAVSLVILFLRRRTKRGPTIRRADASLVDESVDPGPPG